MVNFLFTLGYYISYLDNIRIVIALLSIFSFYLSFMIFGKGWGIIRSTITPMELRGILGLVSFASLTNVTLQLAGYYSTVWNY